MLWPSRELLERHPGHRTAHAALIATILDVLAGRARRRVAAGAPLRDELSDAELRVVRYLPSNLTASEIASELCRLHQHRAHAHAPHLRQARRARRGEAVARARELGLLAPATR